MRTDIKFKNYNGDYALLEKELEKKLSKLDKYFPKDPKANIMISEIRGLVTTEITVTVDSTFLRVEVSDRDVRNAADKAIEKLEAQIKKNKEKLKRKLTDSIRYDESEEDVEQEDLKIVKSKKFAIKPMSAEEAALQMELLGHMFFVFLNADDEAVNVLYKRKDGQYGLIEPEF
ncbi:ribosome hibernation promotion factor [Anaerofustis stercorihominis]|uniref:Ribosome hibernation promoting factor n=1 Tax=Anaerofustis stercorihominis TaxID=214853 RepID=A0A3E3E1U1_9FIRM|nr:HPF/RaiA family ribosome-associated protein [Anaerofustis stercorihominis]RGD75534.1 HPF/RaiA family ribosome-associated protein [Anaerofustis stercorihominis]